MTSRFSKVVDAVVDTWFGRMIAMTIVIAIFSTGGLEDKRADSGRLEPTLSGRFFGAVMSSGAGAILVFIVVAIWIKLGDLLSWFGRRLRPRPAGRWGSWI